MKQKRNILILFVIILIVLGGIVYLQKSKSIFSTANQIKTVKIEQKGLNIIIDPRVELLSSVQLNSNYHLLTTMDFKYKKKMQKYFSKYRNAEAVKAFKNMELLGFIYEAPPHLMLYYSNPPLLAKQTELSKDLISKTGGTTDINNFIENLKVYSKESNFKKFYENNSSFYKNIVKNVAKEISEFDMVGDLESYYGKKQNSYNLILAPLYLGGGYGFRVERKTDSYDIYSIIGTADVEDSIPQFKWDYIIEVGWHEFGHSFVDPLTSKYQMEIMKYSNLYKPISAEMLNQAYGSWESCVNEHVNRAIVARLMYINYGDSRYNQEIKYNKNNGFIYIEAICEKLKSFEINRDKYKTFDDFYPEIVNLFKELDKVN